MTGEAINSLEQARALLNPERVECPHRLVVDLGQVRIGITSNSAALTKNLQRYFGPYLGDATQAAELQVRAIDSAPIDHQLPFNDWRREPGKSGRKDAYIDLPDGRLVLKVRTGMLFLQTAGECVAAGPCLAHDNQLINFINSQYLNWLQQRGWQLGHAAGLVHQGQALAIAGLSGGGKSSLMLRLLEQPATAYLTNDRLLLQYDGRQSQARGIPKWPRINPGTIVHNPRLQPLLSPERRQELLALPAEALWQLEEKYDVDVGQLYGGDRVALQAPLASLLILNWQHHSTTPTRVQRVDLAQRPALLAAIMKSPGPFYQHPDGSFERDSNRPDEAAYLAALRGVRVFEANGRIDFDQLTQAVVAVCFD